MAETFAIIGLVAALSQFVEFGSKVVRQLRRLEVDVAESPVVFRNVRNRLPLMLDLVKKIMLQMDAGLVSGSSQEVMLPVIRSCVSQAAQLDDLVTKALPQSKESSWMRGKKAVMGVLAEPEVERIDAALKANFDLLVQAGTFQSINRLDRPESVALSSTFNLTLLQQQNHATQQPWSELQRNQSTPTQLVFMVPFQRDMNFLGRQTVLDVIDRKFEAQRCIALSGLGVLGELLPSSESFYTV